MSAVVRQVCGKLWDCVFRYNLVELSCVRDASECSQHRLYAGGWHDKEYEMGLSF